MWRLLAVLTVNVNIRTPAVGTDIHSAVIQYYVCSQNNSREPIKSDATEAQWKQQKLCYHPKLISEKNNVNVRMLLQTLHHKITQTKRNQ